VLPDGTQVKAQNVGAYIWNANEELGFANNSGDNNFIGWMQGYDRNDSWTPNATSWTNETNWPDGVEIERSISLDEWTIWQAKLSANAKTLGPSRPNAWVPVIIDHGGTIQGNFASLDAQIPAVKIRTEEPLI